MSKTTKQFQRNDMQEGDSSLRGSEMFIELHHSTKSSSLRRSETLFQEIENVLVLKRDVKLSEQS
jgi:hypothetical protein